MSDITTAAGLKVLFDPGAISAIAGGGQQSGGARAVIYGIAADGLTVSESPEALIQRLKLASSFAKLTRPDGSPILINGKSVSMAREPAPLEYPAEVHSVLFAGVLEQAVRETLDEVRQAIDRAGGSL